MTHWPLFALRITGPTITLRYADDPLSEALAGLAARGIHPPDESPFSTDWALAPSPDLERSGLQRRWRARAEWRPERWCCTFAALRGDEAIGTIDLIGEDFGRLREVTTASWIGAGHQRRGYGTEMRRMAVWFAFAHLEAVAVHSSAWEDNAASIGVSRRLGYRETHRSRRLRRGVPVPEVHLRLDRERWRPVDAAYGLHGFDACRPMFGL